MAAGPEALEIVGVAANGCLSVNLKTKTEGRSFLRMCKLPALVGEIKNRDKWGDTGTKGSSTPNRQLFVAS